MHEYKKEEVLPQLSANLASSVELFGTMLAVDERAVPGFIRNQAFLRRFNLCFLALFEYLQRASDMPREFLEKKPDELADYFIEKGYLQAGDKDSLVMLANIYVAIRWSSAGKYPDEQKIMLQVQPIYEFLKRVLAAQAIASPL